MLRRRGRDVAAVLVVGLFMLPMYWWLLASIKPVSAQFDLGGNVFFDFVPTFDNYAATLFGFNPYEAAGFDMGENYFDSRLPLLSSTVVALCATALSLILSTPAAYALSRMTFRGRERFVGLILLQRLMPPIAIIVPTVYLMRDVKLYNTHAGIILVHSLMNLPVAVLLLVPYMLLATGLGALLAALHTLLRDVEHVVQVLITILFYASPILYPASIAPASMQAVLRYNPLAYFSERLREVLLGSGGFVPADAVVTLACLAVFAAGMWVFNRLSPSFEDFL